MSEIPRLEDGEWAVRGVRMADGGLHEEPWQIHVSTFVSRNRRTAELVAINAALEMFGPGTWEPGVVATGFAVEVAGGAQRWIFHLRGKLRVQFELTGAHEVGAS